MISRAVVLCLALTTLLAVPTATAAAASAPTVTLDPLQLTWMRADQPVASGVADRTWLWGPQATAFDTTEPYAEAPGQAREVIYYDKARMEVNNPSGDPTSSWHVTNGLLVVELMSGRLQTGDTAFEDRAPAEINAVGDLDDPNAPTYAALARLRDAAPAADGTPVTARVDRSGSVTADPSMASYGVSAVEHVQVNGINHQIAEPFWTFMNSRGLVYENGAYTDNTLFQNPFYATGYPVTEAYWTTVRVAGTPQQALIQCFERRCLTYTPGNAPGWQVEAGNVGLHYYQWRYDAPRPDPPRASVTFNIRYNSQQIARVVTQEAFLGETAVGTWATTDANERTISTGTLIAEHPLTGVNAIITQETPIRGRASMNMSYSISFAGITGTGTLDYETDGVQSGASGSVAFTATTTTLDVWDVTVDSVPPVFFYAP